MRVIEKMFGKVLGLIKGPVEAKRRTTTTAKHAHAHNFEILIS